MNKKKIITAVITSVVVIACIFGAYLFGCNSSIIYVSDNSTKSQTHTTLTVSDDNSIGHYLTPEDDEISYDAANNKASVDFSDIDIQLKDCFLLKPNYTNKYDLIITFIFTNNSKSEIKIEDYLPLITQDSVQLYAYDYNKSKISKYDYIQNGVSIEISLSYSLHDNIHDIAVDLSHKEFDYFSEDINPDDKVQIIKTDELNIINED